MIIRWKPTHPNSRKDAYFPLKGDIRLIGRFQVRDPPVGEVAATRHNRSLDEYTRTYESFLEGLLKKSYTFYGPAREIFELHPDFHLGIEVQIQQLIKKRKENRKDYFFLSKCLTNLSEISW